MHSLYNMEAFHNIHNYYPHKFRVPSQKNMELNEDILFQLIYKQYSEPLYQ